MDKAQLASRLSSVTPNQCLVIPRCDGVVANNSWVPGHLSFQLVLSGQIPSTPWNAVEETVLKRGDLLCCAAGAASTRRYDVERKHVAFSIIAGQMYVTFFEREAHDDPQKARQETWQGPATAAMREITQLIERCFREGLATPNIELLALSALEIIKHGLLEPESGLLQKALAWLHLHAHHDLGRNDLAQHLDCHPDHVTRLFRNSSSGSFADERKRLRCERVCGLLVNQDLSLAEIAAQCGFNSETYLIRSFKHIYGCTPGEWRKYQTYAQ